MSVPVGDVHQIGCRVCGNTKRSLADMQPAFDAERLSGNDDEFAAVGRGYEGFVAGAGHGDASRLAANRKFRRSRHGRQVDYAQTIAKLIGDERLTRRLLRRFRSQGRGIPAQDLQNGNRRENRPQPHCGHFRRHFPRTGVVGSTARFKLCLQAVEAALLVSADSLHGRIIGKFGRRIVVHVAAIERAFPFDSRLAAACIFHD